MSLYEENINKETKTLNEIVDEKTEKIKKLQKMIEELESQSMAKNI